MINLSVHSSVGPRPLSKYIRALCLVVALVQCHNVACNGWVLWGWSNCCWTRSFFLRCHVMVNLADWLGAERSGKPYKAAGVTSTNTSRIYESPFAPAFRKSHKKMIVQREWANHFNSSQPQEPHSQHRLLVLYDCPESLISSSQLQRRMQQGPCHCCTPVPVRSRSISSAGIQAHGE